MLTMNSNKGGGIVPATTPQKLFFAIYEDKTSEYKHLIVYRENKKMLIDEIFAKGHTARAVFSHQDIEDIRNNDCQNQYVSQAEIQYLKDNLTEWEKEF